MGKSGAAGGDIEQLLARVQAEAEDGEALAQLVAALTGLEPNISGKNRAIHLFLNQFNICLILGVRPGISMPGTLSGISMPGTLPGSSMPGTFPGHVSWDFDAWHVSWDFDAWHASWEFDAWHVSLARFLGVRCLARFLGVRNLRFGGLYSAWQVF